MLTPPERIEKLERAIERLEEEIRTAATVPIFALRVVIDRLLDERQIEAAWANELWRALGKEMSETTVGTEIVRRSVRCAIPRDPRPADVEQLIRELPERERKVLLQRRTSKA